LVNPLFELIMSNFLLRFFPFFLHISCANLIFLFPLTLPQFRRFIIRFLFVIIFKLSRLTPDSFVCYCYRYRVKFLFIALFFATSFTNFLFTVSFIYCLLIPFRSILFILLILFSLFLALRVQKCIHIIILFYLYSFPYFPLKLLH
jgi:hypothetical protein